MPEAFLLREEPTQRIFDEVIRQVVSSLNRAQSLADQLEIARHTVETAAELLRLSRDRKEFNLGTVVEAVQSEADLTQARLEYLTLLASHNQAQFALRRATGGGASGWNGPLPTSAKPEAGDERGSGD